MDSLKEGEEVILHGMMQKVQVRRSFRGHIPMTEAKVAGERGTVRCVWFNQAYIGKMYPEGSLVKVAGTVHQDSKGFSLSNPRIEKVNDIIQASPQSLFAEGVGIEFLMPVYRETKGITSQYLYYLIKRIHALKVFESVEDPIPELITEKLHLPKLKEALLYIHFPKNKELTIASRKRFSFEEIFYMQLKEQKERMLLKEEPSYVIPYNKKEIDTFIKRFPFTPTGAQLHAIESLAKDLGEGTPMGRLLEGDVGSGKTFVAAVIAHMVVMQAERKGTRLQVAYMVPTEILAKQHFESFISFFEGTGVEIGLLTGSGCKKFPSKINREGYTNISRTQLLSWLKDGKMSVVVGTHALIQKSVQFKDLALVIIDEQHRFGVAQRKSLVRKTSPIGSNSRQSACLPHLLSMTATPIPRTLALTIFGDLDLTVIDEMPKERKKIITEVVSARSRKKVEEKIADELKAGRQVYVICPRIDEQDEEERQKRQLKSVKEEAKRLKEDVFPHASIEILHSKMKADEKEEIMERMLNKEVDILVATSVVEVGVNIPNATVIVIEGAERFGLSQLHQLRGRVGRSEHQSYCFLYSDSKGETSLKRLASLVEAKNGFELAEMDMLDRGIGMLTDGKQWGLSDIAMEAIKNPKLVELARAYAKDLVTKDMELKAYPLLKSLLLNSKDIHME
jgi:ATP-dependent DNA helicase RecG